MNKKSNKIIFVLGMAALLVLANLLSLKGFFRLDLTKDRKYTLSKASVETVKNLKDVLTVRAYFTDDLPPPYAQHARYVRDLLEEYLSASAGNFAFEFTDPTASETEEDKAIKKETKRDIFGRLIREQTSIETELADLGISPVEIRVIEDDQQQTRRAYMGIVIRYQEKHEVIPVVQNLADLEKDLTMLMRKLSREREPKLGIIKDLAGPHIEKVSQTLKTTMALQEVNLTTDAEIADDLDALLIVGSGDHFGEQGAQKIDRFLRKGKSAAFLLDHYNVDPRSFQTNPVGPRSKTHDIFDLLKSYGVEVDSSLVADAACASLNMQENRNGFVFSLPVKYPFVPELMNLSFESQITKGLSGVILPFVSRLIINETGLFKPLVLARSSKVSWLEKEPLDLNPRRNWGDSDIVPDGPHALIAEGRGVLPESSKELQQEAPVEGKARPESRIVVMGTSAFMWDEFLSPSNQVLALNIVDWMMLDSYLLEMRAREFQDAPLDTDISDAMRQAIKYGNILGVPLLLIIYGLMRWRLRESHRRSLKINR